MKRDVNQLMQIKGCKNESEKQEVVVGEGLWAMLAMHRTHIPLLPGHTTG